LNAATAPAPPSRPSHAPTRAAVPAPPKAVKAPAPAAKDRYQLLVISYHTYDQARALKKRIQAKNMPAKVFRVKANKKTYYVVKAGPFTSKQQAEKAAGRLKSEMRLAQAPKIVKIKEASLKTSSRKPPR
jgi:cell division protein FtsN